jgi:hypothetical protein
MKVFCCIVNWLVHYQCNKTVEKSNLYEPKADIIKAFNKVVENSIPKLDEDKNPRKELRLQVYVNILYRLIPLFHQKFSKTYLQH